MFSGNSLDNLPKEILPQLGTMAVLDVRAVADTDVVSPLGTVPHIFIGMGTGFGSTLGIFKDSVESPFPVNVFLALTWVIITPFAIIYGAIEEGLAAPPSDKVKDKEENIAKALIGSAQSINQKVRNSIYQQAAKVHKEPVKLILYRQPMITDGEEDYSGLADDKIDTVLIVQVKEMGFGGSKMRESKQFFFIEAEVRLIRTRDNEEIFKGEYGVRSKRKEFLKWGANKGNPTRNGILKAEKMLSRKIVRSIFGPHD